MGSLFRSESMSLCQIFLQVESSYESIKSLGELGLVQFRDLNPDVNAFQRKFIGEVKRCDEMERRIRLIENEIKRESIPILNVDFINTPVPPAKDMILLETKFEKLENEMKEVIKSTDALNQTWQELNELKHVLIKAQSFFAETEAAVVTHRPTSSHHGHGPHMSGSLSDDSNLATFAVSFSGARTGTLDSVFTANGPPSPVKKTPGPKISTSSLASVGYPVTGGSFKIGELHLQFLTGVIAREKFTVFERMLWRVCRGNVYLKSAEIEESLEPIFSHRYAAPPSPVFKIAFIIFFQGDQLKSKVRKICEGCRATLYPCPESSQEREEMLHGVRMRMGDLSTVIKQTLDHRHRILVSSAREMKTWFAQVVKIKSIYTTLNLFNFDVTQKCLIGEFWCPDADMNTIWDALTDATKRSGSTVPSILNRINNPEVNHSLSPPTFNRTNKVTSGFQAIVDAYGVADYLEVNPVTFTIVTFPFLFAVMFGDTGHGLLMFLFALYLVVKEDWITSLRPSGEIFLTFFHGRYIILLMGLFSMYTGLLYNDVFGKSLNIFGSQWRGMDLTNNTHIGQDWTRDNVNLTTWNGTLAMDPKYHFLGEPYWFGIDPIWNLAGNKILYLNSYKMKLSVILGVGQMLFGTCLSFFNHIHFKNPLNIWFEFIPQVIFLLAIFGYMNSLIFAKWLMYNSTTSNDCPSILLTLISMFMLSSEDTIYKGQTRVQTALLILAVICIPWMLFVKPFMLLYEHKREKNLLTDSNALLTESTPESTADLGPSTSRATGQANGGSSVGKTASTSTATVKDASGVASSTEKSTSTVITMDQVDSGKGTSGDTQGHPSGGGGHGHGDGEFDFGDLMVHQAIHTIEYCLGSISHTASYLRLWALSLAHSQLSEVLWNMVMRAGLGLAGKSVDFGSGLAIAVIFFAWSILSVAILILMEGLSAFLHALRLHWVEFQSKFYSGNGIPFVPFSLRKILEEAEAENRLD